MRLFWILLLAATLLMVRVAEAQIIGGTPANSVSGGTVTNSNVNGQIVVTSPTYGASGSANTYTCTITGSTQTLTCTTATDFAAGQYVAIPTAGQASPLSTGAFAIGAITNIGTATGTDTVCYKVLTGDPAEGIHDVSASASLTTAPLPYVPDWLSNTAYTTNVSYVFPTIGNAGHYVFLSTTGGTSNATTVVPTALAEVGNVVTVTVANTFTAGNTVVLAGNTPAGYNGTFAILTAAAGSFTVYNPTVGLAAGSVFGTAITGPTWPQTVGLTVADGGVTWTNEGPVFSSTAGLNVAFTGNSNGNTVYGVYRDGPKATNCTLDANSAYSFVGTTNASPYKDYGADSPKTWDWPATAPATRNETAYCKIVGGSGTTWTVDCTQSQNQATAPNTATSVTVRHDDTIAVQAAYDAAAAGQQIYFPKGTYHLDMVQIKNPSTGAREGYFFQASNLSDDAAGMIQVEGNKIQTTGAGQDKTFLVSDWGWIANVRNVMFNIATVATVAGYNGPETAGGAPRWTNYAINPVPRGSFCFMLSTPANASNFSIGDFVYLTGGAAINGNYHIANISPITSIGSGGASGQICLRDAITSDIPFGIVGQTPYVEDLTTNNVIQNDMTFENMTISSGASSFSFVDNYNLTWQNINYPEVPANPGSSEFNYGQWGEKILLRNSNIVSNFQEFPVDAYMDMNHNHIRIVQPIQKLAFDGASSTLDFNHNLVELACGSSVVDEQTEPEVHIIANKFISVCPTGGSAQDGGLFQWGTSASLPIGYDHVVSNNVFVTNQKTVVTTGATTALPPNTLFANNDITWLHGTFSSIGMSFGSSAKVIGNKITDIQLGPTQGESMISYTPPASGPGGSIQNNSEADIAQVDSWGVNIASVAYTNPILVTGNVCDGCQRGINIVSVANTTKVLMRDNVCNGGGCTPISPTSAAYAVGCEHGFSAPSAGTGSVTAGSSDCNFEVTGATVFPLTVTFSSTWFLKPFYECTDETTANTYKVLPSTSSVVITGMTANDSVMCSKTTWEGRAS